MTPVRDENRAASSRAVRCLRRVPCGADPDQFVQFGLDGSAVPVLRILHKKDHEEGHNRNACFDDELPSIGKAEEGTAHGP